MSGSRALTWPGREFDQKGTTPSVEQGHCTLIAVKRYRDPPRIGGRHNFLLLDPRWSPCLKKEKPKTKLRPVRQIKMEHPHAARAR